VQDVYKWDGRRIYAGRVESGAVRPGQEVVFLPSGRRTRVRSVEKWRQPDLAVAAAGESVGLTFADEIFVERGEVLAPVDAPPCAARELRASVFWLSPRPFERGGTYRLKLATAEVEATCVEIVERLDSSTLEVAERHASQLQSTEAGTVVFRLKQPLAADLYAENGHTGRFVLDDGKMICGGGIVREVQTDTLTAAAQVIHLDRHLATEPDGNLVDLSREQGTVEFEVTPRFLDGLAHGERILFRLRGPQQIEHVARLAYEHHLGFRFQRDADRVSLVLYGEGPPPPAVEQPVGPGL
jgi:bifunctional enzyme CysN/CysC/sulfate adenylyltransferase subunit 1